MGATEIARALKIRRASAYIGRWEGAYTQQRSVPLYVGLYTADVETPATLFVYRELGQYIEMLVPERFRDRHSVRRTHYISGPKARAMGAGLQLIPPHELASPGRVRPWFSVGT